MLNETQCKHAFMLNRRFQDWYFKMANDGDDNADDDDGDDDDEDEIKADKSRTAALHGFLAINERNL